MASKPTSNNSELESDEVIPETSYFVLGEPAEQKLETKKERAHTLEALPVLKDLLKRLDARIAFFGTVDCIPPEVRLDPEKFLIVYNANEMTRANLRAERMWIADLIEVHAKNR